MNTAKMRVRHAILRAGCASLALSALAYGGFYEQSLAANTLEVTAAQTPAGAVRAWNLNCEKIAVSLGTPPPVIGLDFAILHAATFDAVMAYDGAYNPYHVIVTGATGSAIAAVSAAARDVLKNLFPSREATVDAMYASYLSSQGIDPADPGIAIGEQVAEGIIELRSHDGRFPVPAPVFLGNDSIGQWRPTPSDTPLSCSPPAPRGFLPMLLPWVARVTPFTMDAPDQFIPDPPPALDSVEWAADYNEVKALGSCESTARTADQTQIGYFWADGGPVLWQRASRDLSARYLTNLGDEARMFALVGLAMADASISVWSAKIHYNFWRPITAIRLGDMDGTEATVADPTWTPLLNTPNFPEYTSGHTTSTGAVIRVLQQFFGTDRLTFTVKSKHPYAQPKLPDPDGGSSVPRTFNKFSDAMKEIIDARVFVGIHFRSADRVGRALGLRIGDHTFKNYLRPIGETGFGAR